MRAYAVVKKPAPSSQEHVIKFTKEEPKISIEPISENRFVALHKGANELPMHQLADKGSYFRFNYDGSEKSQRLSERNNHEIKDRAVSESMKSQKRNEAILSVQQQPKQLKLSSMPERESVHKMPRTKRLFQEFLVSPALQQSFNQSNGKDTIDPATPVKAINEYKISSFPVQAQSVLSCSRSQKANNVGQMIRMKKEVQLKPQIYENYEDHNITYQSNSKNVFCCGGSLLSSESNHESRPQPQRRTHLFVPFGSGDISNSPSSQKRKIFEEFQPKSNKAPAIPQDFTFKEPKLGGRIEMPEPQQRKIKVKIYEFPNTIPFDI